jgi:dTDP-4-amino-4,6-dideoxygalactose transaminase
VSSETTLALVGGKPAVTQSDHRAWPDVTRDDKDAVLRVMEADHKGIASPDVAALRDEFAEYTGAKHVLPTQSGTAALRCALVAAGVRPGDTVLVPAISFSATAHAVALIGATPLFVDVDPRTYTIDVDTIRGAIPDRTTAIVPVAMHGLLSATDRIDDFADRTGLAVVWDAAPAVGARDGERRAGSTGTATIFSLNRTKALQCDEGGLLTTNDPAVYEAAKLYAGFGEQRAVPGPHESRSYFARWVGDNCRLSQMLAAYARTQLRRLDMHLAVARSNMELLTYDLAGIDGLQTPYVPPGCTPSPWLPRFMLEPETVGWAGPATEFRDRVVSALAAEGVSVGTWQQHPLPQMPAFRRASLRAWGPGAEADDEIVPFDREMFPGAMRVVDNSFVIGLFPHMLYVQSEALMRQYVRAFRKVFDDLKTVMTCDYEPIRLVPPVTADDLGTA